jgi:hypothetical protein
MNPRREGLAARIRQVRRTLPSAQTTPEFKAPGSDAARREALEARIGELENVVQGLQDSVYRESRRRDGRLTELDARLDPAALAIALSRDVRDRRV